MKRKQVMVLILSGMLATGSVLPVMAADAPAAEAADAETEAGGAEADQSTQTEKLKVPAENLPADNNDVPGHVSDETLPSVPEDAPANPPTDDNDVSGLVSDAALQIMSDNLNRLVDETLAVYNEMTDEEKDAFAQSTGNISLPAIVEDFKSQITFDALKSKIFSASDENEANEILGEFDEYIIDQFNEIKSILNQTKNFITDYNQYLQVAIATTIKKLQYILVTDRLLYTQEYLDRAQVYYDTAITLKPDVQPDDEIIDFCNGVNYFYENNGDYMNTALLDEGLRVATEFAAFLAAAPDPAVANTEFHFNDGTVLTYAEYPDYVIRGADKLKSYADANTLTYDLLRNYAAMLYGNLMTAYDGVFSSILSFASAQVEDAIASGYVGSEKAAYDDALKSYNNTMEEKNYSELPAAADNLKNAAKAYADAAKQASDYYQKLTVLMTDAQQLITSANEWWALLPDSVKSESPYVDAISLEVGLSSALTGSGSGSGITYDLEQLITACDAYEAYIADFNMTDGKIQTAAKAAARYISTTAEKVYTEETKKNHTESVLKTFRNSIDTLKNSIAAFDFNTTRAAATDVKNAQEALLNDRPAKEENKPVPETKNDKSTLTAKEKTVKPVKTGDDTNAAQAGLLEVLSLTGIVSALRLKRRR